jgi:hypothetical protein
LPRMIWDPISLRCRGVRDLTVPWVPTGMKAGVWIWPWAVVTVPRRASPDLFSNLNSIESDLNGKTIIGTRIDTDIFDQFLAV